MNPVAAVLAISEKLESDQLEESFGDEEIIPRCIEMLDIIYADPGRRAEFVEAFKFMWGDPKYGWETIMFCMRVLQWEEIELHFRGVHSQSIAAKDFRAEPCARGILEVFEDGWSDGEDEPYRSLDTYKQAKSEQAVADQQPARRE